MTLIEAVHGLIEPMEEIIGYRLLCPCVRLDYVPAKPRRSR
jgi:hypothetical protein